MTEIGRLSKDQYAFYSLIGDRVALELKNENAPPSFLHFTIDKFVRFLSKRAGFHSNRHQLSAKNSFFPDRMDLKLMCLRESLLMKVIFGILRTQTGIWNKTVINGVQLMLTELCKKVRTVHKKAILKSLLPFRAPSQEHSSCHYTNRLPLVSWKLVTRQAVHLQ